MPRMVGEHKVSVTVQDQPTAGSPYSAKVERQHIQIRLKVKPFSSNRFTMSMPSRLKMRQTELCYQLSLSLWRPHKLDLEICKIPLKSVCATIIQIIYLFREVTVNDGRVPTSAQAQGQHTYAISFTPRDAQNHTVELRFNGQDVPGSPFTCKVRNNLANSNSNIYNK